MDPFAAIPEATVITAPDLLEPYRRDESHVIGELPLAAVSSSSRLPYISIESVKTVNTTSFAPSS